MTQNNKIIFLTITIVVILFTFALGFVVGIKIFQNQNSSITRGLSENNVLEIKRQVLNDLRTEQLLFPLPKELYELDGRIVSLSKDSLLLKPKKDKAINPLGLTFSDTLKIQFSENTMFYNADWKSKEKYDKEREEYLAEIKRREETGESFEGLVSPDMLSYRSIQNTDLKADDYVRIVSEDNILDKEEIEAEEVQILNKIVEDNPFLK